MPIKQSSLADTDNFDVPADVQPAQEPERKIPPDFLLPENHPRILHNQGLAIQELAGLVDDAQREARGIELLFGKFETTLGHNKRDIEELYTMAAADKEKIKELENQVLWNWYVQGVLTVVFGLIIVLSCMGVI